MSSSTVISMQDVSIAHPRSPERPFLSGINWSVEPGDCWVIAGLQSSGKSRVLETAAGLHPFLDGRIQIFGQVLGEHEGDQLLDLRRRIGFVFDGTGRLFPSLTVLENIVLPWCYQHNLTPIDALDEVEPLVQHLDLEKFLMTYPTRLSRGWAHRVAMARAMVLRPELLLIDNPFSGLDPAHNRWWREFMEALLSGHPWFSNEPVTVVLASDELQPVLSIGNQFVLIQDGHWKILGDRQAIESDHSTLIHDLLHFRT